MSYSHPTYHWGLLFLIGMAIWSITIGGHELIGHGGVCAIDPGCQWISANAMYFDGTRKSGVWGDLIRAGGSIFNILLAMLASIWLYRKPNMQHIYKVSLWLMLTINFFSAGSYIGFGWLIHEGMDWAILSASLPQPLGHILVSILGAIFILSGFYLSRRFYPGSSNLKNRAKLWLVPMLGCVFVAVTASLVMPTDNRLMMVQGGIGGSFGFLFWMVIQVFLPAPQHISKSQIATTATSTIGQDSNNYGAIIAVCILLTSFYLLVLTPGLDFQ